MLSSDEEKGPELFAETLELKQIAIGDLRQKLRNLSNKLELFNENQKEISVFETSLKYNEALIDNTVYQINKLDNEIQNGLFNTSDDIFRTDSNYLIRTILKFSKNNYQVK